MGPDVALEPRDPRRPLDDAQRAGRRASAHVAGSQRPPLRGDPDARDLADHGRGRLAARPRSSTARPAARPSTPTAPATRGSSRSTAGPTRRARRSRIATTHMKRRHEPARGARRARPGARRPRRARPRRALYDLLCCPYADRNIVNGRGAAGYGSAVLPPRRPRRRCWSRDADAHTTNEAVADNRRLGAKPWLERSEQRPRGGASFTREPTLRRTRWPPPRPGLRPSTTSSTASP